MQMTTTHDVALLQKAIDGESNSDSDGIQNNGNQHSETEDGDHADPVCHNEENAESDEELFDLSCVQMNNRKRGHKVAHHSCGVHKVPGAAEALRTAAPSFKYAIKKKVTQKPPVKDSVTDPKKAGVVLGTTHFEIPEPVWHVPLAVIPKPDQGIRKGQPEPSLSPYERSKKTSLTIKEKEFRKRAKGQSSQVQWKCETFMKLRQEFD